MQHAIINAMKCMRAIKDRIARPVYQLAIISVSLYTRTVYQPGKSSVRDIQSPSAHHSSVISPGTANLKPSLTGHDNSAQLDVVFLFAHQKEAAPTNRNDVAVLHQLIPHFLRNNQQLVTLNNPDASVAKQNDVAKDTSALLSTADPTNIW
ncbi:cop9 complex subunit 7a [Dorcoceras hygrometricum]|uniref:Cop9 complex subunit 7a n=1 Tax=Dorcoceras hygrometricum TaxID=472368 RepID=A0A2Z7CZM6_9LAMI|nr:cop9 complex subunit 7a [Dorcoceras hygrometricum]